MTTTPAIWHSTRIQELEACPRRWALRDDGWRSKPRADAPPEAPHAPFGTAFHLCAETYDRARFGGASKEAAASTTFALACEITWDAERATPLWGDIAEEWTCTNIELRGKTQRRFYLCDAARDWWAGAHTTCPKCGCTCATRVGYVPHHATKNRVSLLRAVLAYCDDQPEGLRVVGEGEGEEYVCVGGHDRCAEMLPNPSCPYCEPPNEPFLERELHYSIGPYRVVSTLDRYSALDDLRFPHERKTTSRYLGADYWNGFALSRQVALQAIACEENGLRQDGVLLEAVQILSGGVRYAREIIPIGPEKRAEVREETMNLLADARRWNGADALDWPRRLSACGSAAGGRPCEFADVCSRSPSQRQRALETGFEKRERE